MGWTSEKLMQFRFFCTYTLKFKALLFLCDKNHFTKLLKNNK
jgi:hypothetical protein